MTDSSLMEPNNNLEAESTSSRLPTWMDKVITAWDYLQLSCNSYKYSIERMLALDEYTKTTSTLRVLIVCIGTPLPMAVLALLQECIPLQDPMAGWAANYGFWIRVGLLGGVVALALAIHSAYMITGIVISRTQYVAVFLCQALVYSAATIVVAMVWVFPIPFMVLFFLSGYVVLFLGCYTAIVGRQAIRKMQSNKKQALHFILFISVRSIMATLYPVYQLLFNAATGTRYELPTLLLLPIIKLSTKNVLFRTCSHMEDMLPQAVIFTVDFFNSLYLATYTISASSLVSVSIVVVVDLAQIAFNAKRLYQQVTTCMTRLEDMEQSNTSNESLLVMLRSRCNDPEMIKPFLGADIQFKSCLPHQLSSEVQHLLQRLEKSAPNRPQCTCDSESPRKRHAISSPTVVRPRSRKLYLRWKCRSKSSVAPVVKTKSTGPMLSLSPQRRTSPPPTKHDLLSKTLAVLFTVECILLTEYIELIVPAFYGCYVLAVTQLQSAKYHTDVSTDIMNDTFHGIYLTTIMELGAFIALLTVFRWKCSMKALSHLAFVLETQMPLVQSLLLTWILMTISFRVVHFAFLGRVFLKDLKIYHVMIASSSSSTVAPSDSPSEPSPSSSEQEKKQSNDWYANIRQVCLSLQISHGKRYSIERLLALEEYTRNTSFVRALMVCVGTPLPMAALVLLQECVPLQDPTEGWSANFGFWIRVGTLGGVVAIGMAVFAIVMIPGVVLSRLQLVLIFMGQAIGYSVTAMSIAALWVFPIPFMIWTVMGFYMLLFIALFRMIMGKEGFQQMAARRDELMLFVSYSGSQSVMAITYAVYTVLFEHAANTRFELPVIFLLPVIKVTMKNLVSLFIVHMEDMIPEGVIFTVDFFNSMYLTMCMQNTSSITTVATMIALDLGQTAISLRSLHQRSSTILSRLHQVCDITLDSGSLLSVIRLLCHDREKFEQQDRQHVLLRSCLPYTLSQEGQRLLRSLQHVPDNKVRKIPQFSIATLSRGTLVRTRAVKHSNQQWSCLCRRAKSVAPSPALFSIMDNQAPKSSATNLSKSSINPHQNILSETLGVLFTSECLVLTEYLESIIPILYGNFTLLVVNLPSAPYHVNLIGVNRENVEATLFNIYVYALLEFASLVTLALMMMRNCRLQAIYHLAFVLETQAPLVQVKLMTWALMALSFRVVHFGAT